MLGGVAVGDAGIVIATAKGVVVRACVSTGTSHRQSLFTLIDFCNVCWQQYSSCGSLTSRRQCLILQLSVN